MAIRIPDTCNSSDEPIYIFVVYLFIIYLIKYWCTLVLPKKIPVFFAQMAIKVISISIQREGDRGLSAMLIDYKLWTSLLRLFCTVVWQTGRQNTRYSCDSWRKWICLTCKAVRTWWLYILYFQLQRNAPDRIICRINSIKTTESLTSFQFHHIKLRTATWTLKHDDA